MRDVIEWQLDEVYDVSGWDLKKALVLLHDSNPTLHEWCNSPIVYMENELAEPFRELTKEFFLPKKALFHYLSMAERNYKTYLTDEKVRLKKYFYTLRPILAAQWAAERKTAPPMPFDELVEAQLPAPLRPVVQDLLDVKSQTSELGSGPRIPELDAFIQEQLEELRVVAEKEENRKVGWEKLEEYYRNAMMG